MIKFSKHEQETVVTFNAAEETATVYTCDPIYMRKLDKAAVKRPDTFKCISKTDYDRKYEMPKSAVRFHAKRELSEEHKEELSNRMRELRSKKG